MGSIDKGQTFKQDISLWNGVAQTATRETSDAYTLTLNKIDWPGVDVMHVYGGGVNRTKAALTAALTAVGAVNKMRFFLSPGEWAITDDLTITDNITLYVPPGASLAVTAAKTLTIEGPIEAGPYQIFSGAGTITISSVILEHDKWRDGAGDDILPSTDNSIDLGSATQEFKDIYIDGKAHIDTISGHPFPGFMQRPKFEYSTATAIKISAGVYYHCGTTEQLLHWDSELTYTFANLAASDWSYLYLDDSAIVTAGTNLIAIGQMTDSVTEPAWSHAKHGWYNGDDLCIGAVLTDGASEILEFFHDGDFVAYGDKIEDRAIADVDDDWADEATLTIPAFARKALVSFYGNAAGTAAAVGGHWRPNGSSSTTGNIVIVVGTDAGVSQVVGVSDVITDSNLKIDLMYTAAGNHTMGIYTNGWYFPNGM